jgi:hypothetical protein
MKSIRRFVYAALLTLSALSLTPSPASAQEAAGRFTLAHEVHWQNAIVPAGDYRFTLESKGPYEVLALNKVSGSGAGFMILVTAADSSSVRGLSRLILVDTPDGSFVKVMELPAFGMTLHFVVPSEAREVAEAGVVSSASSAGY